MIGEKGRPVVVWCEAVAETMFKVTNIVMHYAPIGVGAAIAYTVGHGGMRVLWNLAWLVGTLYLALTALILGVFLPIALLFRVPIRKFVKAVKEPAVIAFSTSPGGYSDVVGVLLCLLAAVVYSISLVLQKPLVGRLAAVHVTWLACTVGAVACLPFAGQLVREAGDAPASSLWWLVYLGVFPTAIAFSTYAFALKHMSASSLGVTTYLVPPITIVLGVIFLSEAPPTMAYAGGALALVGVAVARRKPRTIAQDTGKPPEAAMLSR